MKTITTTQELNNSKEPLKVQFIYSNGDLAAIHLFTRTKLISYNGKGTEFPLAENNANWDEGWFANYE